MPTPADASQQHEHITTQPKHYRTSNPHLSRRLQHRPHNNDKAGCCQRCAHHIQAQLVKQLRAHSQASERHAAPELALPDLLLEVLLRVVAGGNTLDAHINLL